jgi:hypothetical protein
MLKPDNQKCKKQKMININLKLEFPYDFFEHKDTVPVYFKSRANAVGTCTLNKAPEGVTGSLSLNDELHDNLFVFFLCSVRADQPVLEGLLLDDATQGTQAVNIGSIKTS